MVSIRDVARAAGVSHQTVSNALNSPDIVSADTRERIDAAIKRLGYRPNAAARRLRSGHSDVIALGIAPGSDEAPSPIFDSFTHQLAVAAGRDDKKVMLYAKTGQEREIEIFESLKEQADVDAVILYGLQPGGDARLDWLFEHEQVFALFGRPWGLPVAQGSQIPWADVDGYRGVCEMTKRLLAEGCRHIGYIGWAEGDRPGPSSDRLDGWRSALRQAGLPYAQDPSELETWVEAAPERLGVGADEVARLLARHPDVDAIVCPSDNIAVGVRLAVEKAALPGSVIVTGFDNSRLARAFAFPSVSQPLDQVAQELVRMVNERLRGVAVGNEPRWHRLLRPTVVWRD